MTSPFIRYQEGRPRAVLLLRVVVLCGIVFLTGCSSAGPTPLGASLRHYFPSDEDIASTAEALPYASLRLSVDGNGGLWILARETAGETYWQSQDATLSLSHGYLSRIAGPTHDLLETRVYAREESQLPWAPGEERLRHYRLTRTWRLSDGSMQRLGAEARLSCDSPSPKALPLTTLPLQRCRETLTWQDGSVTTGTLWRASDSGRLWAAETHAWPSGPRVAWEVARPWYQ